MSDKEEYRVSSNTVHRAISNTGVFKIKNDCSLEGFYIKYDGELRCITYIFEHDTVEFGYHHIQRMSKQKVNDETLLNLPIRKTPSKAEFTINLYIHERKNPVKMTCFSKEEKDILETTVKEMPSVFDGFGTGIDEKGYSNVTLNDFSPFTGIFFGCEDEDYLDYPVLEASYWVDNKKVADWINDEKSFDDLSQTPPSDLGLQVYDKNKNYEIRMRVNYDVEKDKKYEDGLEPMTYIHLLGPAKIICNGVTTYIQR